MTPGESTSQHKYPRAPLPFLGLAAAVGVSTLYYNQPLLGEIGHSFHATAGHAGFVAVATQVGYAFGLLLFVPLGDIVERRSLMMRLFGAVSVALLLTAFAPSLTWLVAASALIGLLCSVTHIVVPIAPDLVGDDQRGRAIGTVMTGLLLGVLLARTFSGWIALLYSWRLVFIIAAVINAIFVPLIYRMMPRLPPKERIRYADAMRSLWTFFRTQPLLRESCVLGVLLFASFICFWTTAAFLMESRYGLGSGVTGSFGIVGAVGAMIAPIAGRLSDRRGSRWSLSVGMSLIASAYIILWASVGIHLSTAMHVVALGFGVLILDVGLQICQIANQSRILGLVPEARSRLNTVYMTIYFIGGGAGAALATLAWVHWRWNGVCGLALSFVALSALWHSLGIRTAIIEERIHQA